MLRKVVYMYQIFARNYRILKKSSGRGMLPKCFTEFPVMIQKFNKRNFHKVCDTLASVDEDLAMIIATHQYPPMWTRPNTFETLVHIILEQQVSLASALAALN